MLGWIGPLTHRQYLTYIHWLEDIQFHCPTMDQQYLMRIAQRIHQGLVKEPDKLLLNDERVGSRELKYTKEHRRDETKDTRTDEEVSKDMKRMLGVSLGVPKEERKKWLAH